MNTNFEEFYKGLMKDIDKIPEMQAQVVEDLTNLAYSEVISKCSATKLENHLGNIEMNIDKATNTGIIGTNDDVIVFKEYGTGQLGNNTVGNHVGMTGWGYNPDKKDWYYPTNESDPNPYKYQTKDGKWFAFTHGLEAGGMFYDTYVDLVSKADTQINVSISKFK